jgi:hypothetical protein
MDLMAALKASVEASRQGGKSGRDQVEEAEAKSTKPRVVKARSAATRSQDKAEEKPRRRVAKAS